jgi:hypothetical protein
MPDTKIHPASFRDPSGFVFTSGNTVYRQLNAIYAGQYQKLMSCGLYDELVKKNSCCNTRRLQGR